jgi:hypothetical protein
MKIEVEELSVRYCKIINAMSIVNIIHRVCGTIHMLFTSLEI